MTVETNILLVDSYDSFTFNLAALIRLAIPDCRVYIIQNDFRISDLLPFLRHFSAIVVGPGPGSPDRTQDVGIVKELWHLQNDYLVPIFGVCLGLQSLCLEHGGRIQRLVDVKHGQISPISHNFSELFMAVNNPLFAVRYHSLHAILEVGGNLEPLAWADDGMENGRILMAVQHKVKPFWAVQYHPESIQTDSSGIRVMQNFWQLAQQWTAKTNRRVIGWSSAATEIFGYPWSNFHHNRLLQPHFVSKARLGVLSKTISLSHLNMAALCELYGALDESSPFVLLDSAASPGRYSILACLLSSSLRITYHLNESVVRLTRDGSTTHADLGGRDIWTWLSDFMRKNRVTTGPQDSPFWGGLVGTLSYELGVQTTLGIPANLSVHPDVNFVFVERSVVADAATKRIFVQSLIDGDDKWIADTISKLSSLSKPENLTTVVPGKSMLHLPDKDHYLTRIHDSMRHLHAGDSYELCLTAQTHITTTQLSSWERYKALRQKNPAPFSAYIRLHPTTLLSSSPERFLSFTRPPKSICQLRPIKGTVRKGPGVTFTHAQQALAGSVKEVAENLMIVDLIRHDLHGVVGENVKVTKFCGVEEYETVFQLVSVIEGELPQILGLVDVEEQLGWEVLKRSLPPGSMTGAPKKRSVEILQTLEGTARGIYSGVFGYWCVGGAGDWAVTIRSCFKHADTVESSSASSEKWTIGAGGAITALSDPDAEWEEMLVKLQSVLRSF